MAEKNLPFISVIVPFYNIEECVEYCLDSLVAQDYEGEFEVLCIDDGSTDNTPPKLDAYAADKSNVRVLHKPNGGLSDARNYGVEHAVGEYVSFVDGDDFVSPFYLSSLSGGLRFGEDIMVVGEYQNVNFSEIASVPWARPTGARRLNKAAFVSRTCFDANTSVWGRLAKKELYLSIPNPVGRVYEDTYITAEHIDAVSSIAIVETPIYGYVARSGSIAHRKQEKFERCVQLYEAINRFCNFVDPYYSSESDQQVAFKSLFYSRLWRSLDLVADSPSKAQSMKREVRSFVKDHLGQLLRCDSVSRGNKVRFALLATVPALYRASFSIYDKIFRGLE